MNSDTLQYLSMLTNPGALAFLFGAGVVSASLIIRRLWHRRAVRSDHGSYCASAVASYVKK